ncbi:MAG: uroporphyrinogen decarboxylase family protein [Clostridiales bacterium]
MTNMTRVERLSAVLAGNNVDRIPVSVWMHLNELDQDSRSLAEAMIDFNEKFDYDFIKVMPFGAYTTPDWGTKLKIFCNKYQEVEIAAPGVVNVEDYLKLEPLAPTYGTWGKTLQLAQWVSRELERRKLETPFIQTIFSPASTLKKLTGDKMFTDLVNYPEAVHHALEVITETTVNFVQANINAGVSGFFFATQCATYNLMTDVTFAEFCKPYDLRVINAYKDKTWFNVIHLHGVNTMFETINKYPCPVLNWHDRQDGPTMEEAKKKSDKIFLGGLQEGPSIVNNQLVYDSILAGEGATPESIEKHIHEAIDMMDGKRIIVGPGCVADPHSSDKNLKAVRLAVETWKRRK